MIALFTFVGLVGLAVLLLLGIVPVYPLQSRKTRESLITTGAAGPLVLSVTSATASPDLTAVAAAAGLAIGATVTAPSGPMGKTVIAIDDAAHTATLSGNAGITGTQDFTFANPSTPSGLTGKSFRLFKATYTPSVNTVLADLTEIEADFTGYAPITLAMTQGYVDGTSTPVSQSQLLKFLATDAVTPNQIYGWWVDDGTNVLEVQLFSNPPVPMASAGAELSGVLADSYPTSYGWQPLIPALA